MISLKCWLRHCVCVSAMFSHWLAAKAQTLSMNQSCCAVTSISPPHAVIVLTSSSEGVLCGCNRVRCACEVLGRSSFVFWEQDTSMFVAVVCTSAAPHMLCWRSSRGARENTTHKSEGLLFFNCELFSRQMKDGGGGWTLATLTTKPTRRFVDFSQLGAEFVPNTKPLRNKLKRASIRNFNLIPPLSSSWRFVSGIM